MEKTHANNILPILIAQGKDRKDIVFIKVGNRSDWNLYLMVNEYYFFKLWKDSGLDIIGVVSYAAKYSACNNIELTWSLMCKTLIAMIHLSVLEGDSTPPWKKTELIKNERRDFFSRIKEIISAQ